MATNTKNTRKLKLSRREHMRRNPVIWIGLLAISLICGGVYVIPNSLDWQSKNSRTDQLELANTTLEKAHKEGQIEINRSSQEFKESAKDFLAVEAQLLPATIQTDLIAQVIEVYALTLEKTGKQGSVEIRSINFGSTLPVEGKGYYETSANLSISITQNNLKKLIEFLQNGTYDQSLYSRFENRDDFFSEIKMNFDFLDRNLMPLNHVSSISVNQKKDKNIRNLVSVEMQLSFFSLENPNAYESTDLET